MKNKIFPLLTENGQTLKGITPLMWAARNGKLEAVKFLAGKEAKRNGFWYFFQC